MAGLGPRVDIMVRPGTSHIDLRTGQTWNSPSGPTTFETFMRSGYFEGQNPLDLCRRAIEFWRTYLDSIDRRIEEDKR
jgi:hypothetical protein